MSAGQATTWLRRRQPTGAPVQLVCFPHAGGSASYYFPVARMLAPHVDVLAVQYPGRQDRRSEPFIDSIDELAENIVPELLPLTDRPFALFGHSMGATLAFEVARRLQEQGATAIEVFASGRRAPSAHREERTHVTDERIITDLRALSGTNSRFLADDEMLRMVLPAIRNDYKAAETYRYQPGPRLTMPITALIGEQDPKVTIAEAQQWEQHTSDRFELLSFTGGHFYLNDHIASITSLITERLRAGVTRFTDNC